MPVSEHAGDSHLTITGLRFEQRPDALGLGTAHPRISWMSETTTTGWYQSAYEIEVWSLASQLLETTGRVESDQSVLVAWPFAALSSRERRLVRVRVWGNDGLVSAWSALTPVEAGLLGMEDWYARFITADSREEAMQPLPLLRRAFTVRPGLVQARLYITALGTYEALEHRSRNKKSSRILELYLKELKLRQFLAKRTLKKSSWDGK